MHRQAGKPSLPLAEADDDGLTSHGRNRKRIVASTEKERQRNRKEKNTAIKMQQCDALAVHIDRSPKISEPSVGIPRGIEEIGNSTRIFLPLLRFVVLSPQALISNDVQFIKVCPSGKSTEGHY